MEQKKRLVELLKKADESASNKTITDYEDAIKDNADYLIANNVVVLPCKVGDNVFFLHYGEICEATVVNVEYNYYTTPKEWITVEYRSQAIGTNRYKTRIDLMWGKTVFPTREEAEEKVKEMGNGN